MSVHRGIRLLTGQDIDPRGDLYFPWTTKEKTIEKMEKIFNGTGEGDQNGLYSRKQ